MKLLDEIINGAITDSEPVSNLLRRCLVLANNLKNEKLAYWANKELDGYDGTDDLPEYRQAPAISKGLLLGGGGSHIKDQPLSLHFLKPEHRALVDTIKLHQPISSYESGPKGQDAQLQWPPELTVRYQSAYVRGYALNRAWQEIPASVMVGLIDTVRNRVLRFGLELRDELEAVDDNPSKLAAEAVDRSVINNIYGGNIFIAGSAHNITQVSSTQVAPNNMTELVAALQTLGLEKSEVAKLQTAIQEDQAQHGADTLGHNVRGWLKQIGTTVGKEGLKVGVDVAKRVATKWIMQYFGLDV